MRKGRGWATGIGAVVLVLLGLPVAGAATGERDAWVSGVLLVAADGPGHDRAFALALDDGSLVPLVGILSESWANARVSVQVRVPADTGLRPVARPWRVSDARLLPAEAEVPTSTVAGTAHQVYVARPTNVGGYTLSTTAVLAEAEVVASFWEDEANGAVSDVAVPGVVTTYTTGFDAATVCSLSQFFPMVSEAAELFPDAHFFGPGATDLLAVLTPDVGCSANTLGVGTIGGSFASGGATLTRASTQYVRGTLAHEIGHNFGLQHSNVGAQEYHDIYNVMGFGIAGYHPLTALSTAYRVPNAITDPGEVEVLPTPAAGQVATLTREIAPRSDETGLRSISVTAPGSGQTYLVDYRSGTGQDAGSAYAAGFTIGDLVFRPGVVVEQVQEYSAGSGVSLVPDQTSGRVAAVAGDTWTSPDGAVTVLVETLTPTGARVTVTSRAVAPAPDPGGPPTPIPVTSVPVIHGLAKVGRTLVADTDPWSPDTSLAWQWLVDGAPLPGATGSTFTAGPAQRGHVLAVVVTGTRPGSPPTSQTSAPTAPVAAGTLAHRKPRVSGRPEVGRTVTARPGAWAAGVRLTYQWLAGGRPVAKGLHRRLVVGETLVGTRLAVRVTARKAGYRTVTVRSARTAPVSG